MSPSPAQAERHRLANAAHERESFRNIEPDTNVRYVSMGTGISPGQGTAAVVHVGISEDGTLLTLAVEAEPTIQVHTLPLLRRPRWRFYDFWRYDREKHDNAIRPESEWPVIDPATVYEEPESE